MEPWENSLAVEMSTGEIEDEALQEQEDNDDN